MRGVLRELGCERRRRTGSMKLSVTSAVTLEIDSAVLKNKSPNKSGF